MTPEERQRLLDLGRGARRPVDGARLPDLVADRVRRCPDAPAVEDRTTTLTFRQLLDAADEVATRLRAAGLGPDMVVGVAVGRSVELMVQLLGVLRAGGAYLPLDPTDPPTRLAGMVTDAGAVLVIADEANAGALRAAVGPPVVTGAGPVPALRGSRPERPSDLDLAYVIYTSGSTGRPKAVGVPHRGIVNRLRWMQETYQLTPADAVLQKTPYTFDVSVWELFWPLLSGARLVMARPEGHRDPQYLAAAIQRHRVTVVHFVPSMLGAMLAEPDFRRCVGLRLVICSGEALPPASVNRFRQVNPARLDNLYGPTEASVDVTWWPCAPVEGCVSVPIGRPISNVDVRVLDASGQLCPVGVPGELYLGGDVALARGYLGRPALTAERFVPDRYARTPGARLYRTGDLARWRPDGVLEYLGRLDDQIKVRGHRIEPGEIEHALRRHPAVSEAVVAARTDGAGTSLVGYVVVRADGPGERALRGWLAEELPAPLVPARIVVLDRLPLTANGKLNRAALPPPGRRRPHPTPA